MDALKINANFCSDIGKYRLNNEDYALINKFLFILADGMGGHNGGEIASKLAVHKILNFLTYTYDFKNQQYSKNQIFQLIKEAIDKANETVYLKSIQNNELKGMGSTVVLAMYQKPNNFYIANVGDSRAYLIRKNKIKILSEDHSITASMLREGIITKDEEKTHPYRHHLSRSIGINKNVEAFIQKISIHAGDKILLCSDGFWNVVSDNDIIKLFWNESSTKQICQKCIQKAIKNDSKDNITSIVILIS